MTAGSPRTLLVTVDLPPARGGIQTMVREVCAHSANIEAVVAPGPRGPHGIEQPVTLAPSLGKRARIASLALAVRMAARKHRPDVILAMHPLAALGAARLGIPFVLVVHGGELRSSKIARAAAWVFPRAARIVANSQWTAEAAVKAGADPERITVIHVGGPEARSVGDEDIARVQEMFGGGRIVLAVGRLEPHKGQDVVIDAASRLPSDVRVVLVGEGSSRAALERQANELGLTDRVVFAGRLSDDDLAAAYAGAEAFVLLSRETTGVSAGVEGGGIVLLEAAAYGLPIIAARSGGIPETITDGRTGLLVEPGDAGAAAAAIEHVLNHPEHASTLGSNARAMATTDRTWARFTQRLDAVLAEVAQ